MGVEYTETVFPVKPHYTILDVHPHSMVRENARMEFGVNMKRFRKAKGWTQAQLAERLSVEQPTVQRWEAGKRDPSHDELENLARELGVTVADLFREGDAEPVPNADELQEMIQIAMSELPIGVSYADYPGAVASSLREQLVQFSTAGGFLRNPDAAPALGTDAPPHQPTKRAAEGARRSA